jgi:hypothetical protein
VQQRGEVRRDPGRVTRIQRCGGDPQARPGVEPEGLAGSGLPVARSATPSGTDGTSGSISGGLWATCTPLRGRLVTIPRPRRSRYAAATVAGLTPRSSARARTDGSVVPAASAPDSTPASTAAAIPLHGSTSSRMMRHLAARAPVCVTVTLLDGLVLARSVMHHSMNYRSAVVFGTARPVTARGRTVARSR